MDYDGLGDKFGLVRGRLAKSEGEEGCARKERRIHSVGHRRTHTAFVVEAPDGSPRSINQDHRQLKSEPPRFGKQSGRFDSPRRQMSVLSSHSVIFR
jgi:hypothetical protein